MRKSSLGDKNTGLESIVVKALKAFYDRNPKEWITKTDLTEWIQNREEWKLRGGEGEIEDYPLGDLINCVSEMITICLENKIIEYAPLCGQPIYIFLKEPVEY